MKKLALIAMTLLLSACGSGGGSSDGGGTTTPPVVTPPVVLLDSFYSAVLALIGSSPEDKEPAAIDSIAATAPDNTEPVEQ